MPDMSTVTSPPLSGSLPVATMWCACPLYRRCALGGTIAEGFWAGKMRLWAAGLHAADVDTSEWPKGLGPANKRRPAQGIEKRKRSPDGWGTNTDGWAPDMVKAGWKNGREKIVIGATSESELGADIDECWAVVVAKNVRLSVISNFPAARGRLFAVQPQKRFLMQLEWTALAPLTWLQSLYFCLFHGWCGLCSGLGGTWVLSLTWCAADMAVPLAQHLVQ